MRDNKKNTAMKELIFATLNKGKLREASEILGGRYSIVSPADRGVDSDVEETGQSFEENSRIKAQHLYGLLKCDCFADDSGLEVDALDGAPGIFSARYAGGKGHDDSANIDKLLSELAKKGPGASRRARFRTAITLIVNGEEHVFEGKMEGSISFERKGANGFGYDPVFTPDAHPGKTVAELSDDEKNAISHRGAALRAMAEFLGEQRF